MSDPAPLLAPVTMRGPSPPPLSREECAKQLVEFVKTHGATQANIALAVGIDASLISMVVRNSANLGSARFYQVWTRLQPMLMHADGLDDTGAAKEEFRVAVHGLGVRKRKPVDRAPPEPKPKKSAPDALTSTLRAVAAMAKETGVEFSLTYTQAGVPFTIRATCPSPLSS